jgi:hypothetical protein
MTTIQSLLNHLEMLNDRTKIVRVSSIIDTIKESYLPLEEDQLKKAIIYSLDEDGHTGEWKIKFANNYYKKLKEN